VAYHFELIRAIFREIFSLHGSSPDPPVIIIAAKDDATLLPLLPDIYREKKAMHPAGLYMGGPEKNYVALRLDVTMGREAYQFHTRTCGCLFCRGVTALHRQLLQDSL